jgi:hypothetical protein
VFLFDGETHRMLGKQHFAARTPATADNRAKMVKWIKTLKPDNDTAPEEALERALKLQPQVIYFLTDGELPPTTGDTDKGFEPRQKTVIHTIAFGTEEGADMLKAIPRDNGANTGLFTDAGANFSEDWASPRLGDTKGRELK